ncbi:HipA family kinase [Aurantiacibacter suaedae]|uniref:HipA family kinase n=1 Tax=Aurantiacibacter suaedae TaxID=2545755 RepID=UPI0010F98F3C|nr:HipA family kinase [Aurantiacibacter suaedae]
MLRRLEAVQFVGDVGSGRTRPIIVAGEDDDENVIEVVVKFSSSCEMGTSSLAVEVIAACLAGTLGLPIPEPFIVVIPDDWRGCLPDDVRGRFSEFDNLAFGSKLLWPQWPAWAVTNHLTPSMVQTAAEVLAFDGFIENMDRRDGNPNCLVSGEQIRIFDHELAFPRGLLGPKPWAVGGLQPFTEPGHHIFRRELLAKGIDFAAIREKWANLLDDDIDAYGAAVPGAWRDDGFLADILTKIRQVRDNIGGCMTELDRILR